MRSQITLSLFLSFSLPSMGHLAKSPPNSLQSRDHDQLPSFGKREDWHYGDTCKDNSFNKDTCQLTAHCLPEGKNDRVESHLNMNKCLVAWVKKGEEKNKNAEKFFGWSHIDEQYMTKVDGSFDICKKKKNCKMDNMRDFSSGLALNCDKNWLLPLGYRVSRNNDGYLVC